MGKFFLSAIIAFGFCVGHAHESDPSQLTENQLEALMANDEILKGFEQARILQNTVLNSNIRAEYKCLFLGDITELTQQIAYTVDQYQSALQHISNSKAFYDEGKFIGEMRIEQYRTHLIQLNHSTSIMKTTHNCKSSI